VEVRDRAVPLGWFVVVTLVAVVAVLYALAVTNAYNALSADYDLLYDEYTALEHKYDSLSESYESLSAEYNDLYDDYWSLYEDYLDLNLAYSQLRSDFEDYVYQVFQWLYGASEMSPREFSQQTSGCVHGEFVNYPCILFRRDFQYIPDAGDRASAYPEFISRGGGDCEDFAFYALALVNAASRVGYRLRFYRESPGHRFFLTTRYYLPDAETVEVTPYRAYVVCGLENEDDNYEHCIVQVCDLVSCIYVEPQTGEVVEHPFVEVTRIISRDDIVWYGVSLRKLAMRQGVFPP